MSGGLGVWGYLPARGRQKSLLVYHVAISSWETHIAQFVRFRSEVRFIAARRTEEVWHIHFEANFETLASDWLSPAGKKRNEHRRRAHRARRLEK